MPRSFAIGDIHGCIDEVNVLLDGLRPAADDTLVFLGDYIDRGPSPKAVIDRLLRLRREGPRCIFLRGNHEDMFLDFLGLGGRFGEAFLYNGGAATLRSYGLEGGEGEEVARRMPEEHLAFLRELQTHYREKEF